MPNLDEECSPDLYEDLESEAEEENTILAYETAEEASVSESDIFTQEILQK